MVDMFYKLLEYAAIIIASAIVLLNGLAPLTKSDIDNKLLAVFRWIEEKVLRILLPQHFVKQPSVDPDDK